MPSQGSYFSFCLSRLQITHSYHSSCFRNRSKSCSGGRVKERSFICFAISKCKLGYFQYRREGEVGGGAVLCCRTCLLCYLKQFRLTHMEKHIIHFLSALKLRMRPCYISRFHHHPTLAQLPFFEEEVVLVLSHYSLSTSRLRAASPPLRRWRCGATCASTWR